MKSAFQILHQGIVCYLCDGSVQVKKVLQNWSQTSLQNNDCVELTGNDVSGRNVFNLSPATSQNDYFDYLISGGRQQDQGEQQDERLLQDRGRLQDEGLLLDEGVPLGEGRQHVEDRLKVQSRSKYSKSLRLDQSRLSNQVRNYFIECRVCKGLLSNRHNYYGCIGVCVSCRGFFRRSVQSGQHSCFECLRIDDGSEPGTLYLGSKINNYC